MAKSYRKFLAGSVSAALVSKVINTDMENCIMCNKEIDTDNDKCVIDESGEYWCPECAELIKETQE
ncbi:hypothetical protein [Cytobacillus sp. IB215316]|uniref:hypothetical protein n=1 Tax=Cytobacillus sp. IB215316 TaxID=3097354 RepID=UPI002A0C2B3C|nr:hypothetical protein [Cytobacillus sp. IB215316]MDX8362437.1 hypothetical protein [Cytobacillus sp. IB215316]